MNATSKRRTAVWPVFRLFGRMIASERIASLIVFPTALAGFGLSSLVIPLYYKKFFDTLAANEMPIDARAELLVGILFSIAGLFFLMWLSWRIHEFTYGAAAARIMTRLVNVAFENLIFHSYHFFTNSFTGSLVRKITRLSRSFESFIDLMLYNILPTALVLIGIPFVLYERSPLLSFSFLGFALTLLTFHILLASWKQKYNIAVVEMDSLQTAALSDSISNEHTVKLFSGEDAERQYVHSASTNLEKARIKSWNISYTINLVQGGFMIITEVVLLYVTIRLWQAGQVTIGDFALVQAYLITASNQLWGFNRTIRGIYEAIADASEMVEIMETPYDVNDPINPKSLTITKAEVALSNVSFNFNETRTVLPDLSLTISGGERVAFVGPSGAGKSTIVKLLLRLHDVTSGEITIDGTNIAHVRQQELRSVIGFVPQEPILFHRTLMDNIRYGRMDATDEEVIEAAKQAHCHEFIDQLPEKYQTFVGERGVKLSGGERQRVAIARAILKNAPILILDEATSSLDSESEQYIQEALEVLMQGKTVIVIAHRLSTIMRMDRIVVIEEGQVVDSGTHSELVEKEGLYKKLWGIQAGGFIAE